MLVSPIFICSSPLLGFAVWAVCLTGFLHLAHAPRLSQARMATSSGLRFEPGRCAPAPVFRIHRDRFLGPSAERPGRGVGEMMGRVPPAISISGLVKNFGSTRALDGLDLSVETGEVHGFLGPNGSGKTTTIRVLLGLLRADAGQVALLGGDPWRDAVALHRRLAYVPGEVSLWPNLTGGEVIDLFGRLRGDVNRRRCDDLLQRFQLDPTKKTRSYSKGNRQKVGLVAALASDAELLLLDEPTSGLDPLMEAVFQACIGEVKAQGRTVLLSSHILAEVEALCDRLSIIRLGRTEQSGTLLEMRHLTRTSITAELKAPAVGLDRLPGIHGLEVHGSQVGFDVDSEHLGEAVRLLGEIGVISLVSHPPTLEELFLRHYGDEFANEPDQRTAAAASGREGRA